MVNQAWLYMVKAIGFFILHTPYWTLDDSQRQYAVGYRKDDSIGYKRNAYNYHYGFLPLSAGGAWSGKATGSDHFSLENIDHPSSELSTCY